MFNTPKMGIPWMSEFEDPFIVTDQAKAAAVDNWLQAIYESTSYGVNTTGPVDVDTSANTVTWHNPIIVASAQTGGVLRVLANTHACADGEVLYIEAPARPLPVGMTDVPMLNGPALGVSQTAIVIGRRYGGDFYFANRAVEANYHYFGESSFCELKEEQPAATDAGDFNSGSWVVRALNSQQAGQGDDIAFTAPPTVELQKGTYFVEASAPAYRVDKHQTRLRDITTGTTLLQGSTEMCGASTGLFIDVYVQTRSFVSGYIDLRDVTEVQLQHRCFQTRLVDGLGLGVWGPGDDFGETECFAKMRIKRVR